MNGPRSLDETDPVDFGKVEIKNHQVIVALFLQDPHRLFAIMEQINGVSLGLQLGVKELREGCVILNNQHTAPGKPGHRRTAPGVFPGANASLKGFRILTDTSGRWQIKQIIHFLYGRSQKSQLKTCSKMEREDT
jgi:hypothetical protein